MSFNKQKTGLDKEIDFSKNDSFVGLLHNVSSPVHIF